MAKVTLHHVQTCDNHSEYLVSCCFLHLCGCRSIPAGPNTVVPWLLSLHVFNPESIQSPFFWLLGRHNYSPPCSAIIKILAACLVLMKINSLSMSWPALLNYPHILAASRKNRGVISECSKENYPETHPRQPKLLLNVLNLYFVKSIQLSILHPCLCFVNLGGLLLYLMFVHFPHLSVSIKKQTD